jgi:hypothetical protein
MNLATLSRQRDSIFCSGRKIEGGINHEPQRGTKCAQAEFFAALRPFVAIFNSSFCSDLFSDRALNMGSAGDSPAPVGEAPTGTALSHIAKRPFRYLEPLFPFRPAGRLWRRICSWQVIPIGRHNCRRKPCPTGWTNCQEEAKRFLKVLEERKDRCFRDALCGIFFDIRFFGGVLSTEGPLKESFYGQVRGPLQFTFAESLDKALRRSASHRQNAGDW